MTEPPTPSNDLTARLRDEHRLETHPLQRAVDRVTGVIGRPASIILITLAIPAWAVGNLLVARLGAVPVDPPPFIWLQGVTAAGALLMAVLILTTQRREDELAGHRAQMNLELAVLNDQKLSKIIGLLEEERRDNPALRDRFDGEAAAMSTPADTRAVLEAIKDTQAKEA